MKTILENPRYTGRQAWNRMTNDRDEVDPRTGRPGQFPNLPQDWAISMDIAHAPLVGMREFTEAQKVRARRPAGDGGRREYPDGADRRRGDGLPDPALHLRPCLGATRCWATSPTSTATR
nr:recombinase family protein [Saccharothrix luteola]